MEYKIKAIPTEVNGVTFRSRLEARWAAFFDHINIPWTYEPYDLNGWIPDFLLSGPQSVLVEVKPFAGPYHDPGLPLGVDDDIGQTIDKIDASGCEMEVILLGAGPFKEDQQQCVGWIREQIGEEARGIDPEAVGKWWWQKCYLAYSGFVPEYGSWVHRPGGDYDGFYLPPDGDIQNIWNRCLTQWKPKK